MAAEDVGLAYPQAMAVTKACVDAARELGLPEARLPLAEAAILLATAPKSNSAHNAIIAAMDDIRRGRVGQVPRHLQNVHADSTGSGKAPAYKYPHDYPHHYVAQRYLPEALGDVTYYEYGDNKTEQAARRYWEDIKKKLTGKAGDPMDLKLHDVVELKKEHPCGSRRWEVLRVGMDIRLRCAGCGHEVLAPRRKVEKSIKRVIPKEEIQ